MPNLILNNIWSVPQIFFFCFYLFDHFYITNNKVYITIQHFDYFIYTQITTKIAHNYNIPKHLWILSSVNFKVNITTIIFHLALLLVFLTEILYSTTCVSRINSIVLVFLKKQSSTTPPSPLPPTSPLFAIFTLAELYHYIFPTVYPLKEERIFTDEFFYFYILWFLFANFTIFKDHIISLYLYIFFFTFIDYNTIWIQTKRVNLLNTNFFSIYNIITQFFSGFDYW